MSLFMDTNELDYEEGEVELLTELLFTKNQEVGALEERVEKLEGELKNAEQRFEESRGENLAMERVHVQMTQGMMDRLQWFEKETGITRGQSLLEREDRLKAEVLAGRGREASQEVRIQALEDQLKALTEDTRQEVKAGGAPIKPEQTDSS